MIRAAADEIEKPRVEVLTIRQRFVMAAMEGLCDGGGMPHVHWIAIRACEIADATLAEEARTRAEA